MNNINMTIRIITIKALLLIALLLSFTTVQAQKNKQPAPTGSNEKASYIFLEAQRQILAGHADAAYDLLEYCKQLDPDNAAVLYSLAPLNVALQRDSLATLDMERATRLSPKNYWYQELLAKLHFARHRPAEALKVLEQMHIQWSDKTELLYMLIDTYASQNMTDSLLHAFEKLEVKEGKSEQISLEKVKIYVQRNDVKSLLEELEALLKANPSSQLPVQLLPQLLKEKSDAYTLLGDLYHLAGNDDRAFQYYDSCLVYKPDDAMVLNNYAYYLSLQQRNLDTAEQMSRRSNELEPDNPTYLDTLAWVLYQQGRYAEAKQLMDKVQLLMKPEDLENSTDVKEHIQQIDEKVNSK